MIRKASQQTRKSSDISPNDYTLDIITRLNGWQERVMNISTVMHTIVRSELQRNVKTSRNGLPTLNPHRNNRYAAMIFEEKKSMSTCLDEKKRSRRIRTK